MPFTPVNAPSSSGADAASQSAIEEAPVTETLNDIERPESPLFMKVGEGPRTVKVRYDCHGVTRFEGRSLGHLHDL